jgi:hypothetical protein
MLTEDGRILDPNGNDITREVFDELKEGVLLQRAKAIVAQRKTQRLRGYVSMIRDSHGNAVAAPVAQIDPNYYFAVMTQRKLENKYLREHDLNTWADRDFVKWEMKQNEALKPMVNRETRYFQTSNKGLECPLFDAHGRVLP